MVCCGVEWSVVESASENERESESGGGGERERERAVRDLLGGGVSEPGGSRENGEVCPALALALASEAAKTEDTLTNCKGPAATKGANTPTHGELVRDVERDKQVDR